MGLFSRTPSKDPAKAPAKPDAPAKALAPAAAPAASAVVAPTVRVAAAESPRAQGTSLWTDSFGRVGTRSLQVLAVVAALTVFVYLATQLTLIVIPVLIALLLAAAISPLVQYLRHKGLGPLMATWIALIALLALLSAVVWLVVRAVSNQWDELRDQAVEGFRSLSRGGLPIEISDEQVQSLRDSLTGLLQSDAVGSGAIAGVSQGANFIAGLAIMIVVLFFFLKDGPGMWEFFLRPFEGHRYQRGRRVGAATIHTMGEYVRGTAIVAAVDAVGIGIGLLVLQVPLAIPLTVLTFLLAFIPLVGATLAGVIAALVALVAVGPLQALGVLGVVIVVNQLEGNLLQPIVMGRALHLHPLMILVALTAGTVLAGITGAVLAVPIAASLWRAVQVWDGPDLPARFARQKRVEDI